MSDNEIKQYQDTEEQANNLDMKAIWHLFIGKWKWFVASVIVCVALGAYYLLKTPKQYSRSAIVLIKDESKQQGIGSDISSMFSNLGYSMGQTNVNNELYDIQAPSVIWEAGHRLGLDVTYIVPKHVPRQRALRKHTARHRPLPRTDRRPDRFVQTGALGQR